MRILKLTLIFVILFGFPAPGLPGSADGPGDKGIDSEEQQPDKKSEIEWQAYDVGLKKALDQNKHVFIDFTAKWCGYCRKMEREVFTDARIIDILNNDFIPVRVDGDSRNELDIDGYKVTERNLATREYGVRGYPTFWFLKPDGTKLGPLGGYRPTEFMLEALTFVKEYRYDSTSTEGEKEED
jgi:thioredoxin-related protein